ncbi:MAG TPA: nascent polypeptide-associated complex protein [Methanomicrobiales archaeon]|nr:nascent polypeptide-associated complex protein [Methanomicrobiales archaeon]
MFPGRVNPRKMKQMMDKMGMSMEPLEGVERVVISTAKGEYVFDAAEVVAMTMQGVKTFQITGEPRFEAKGPVISEEDVRLVMEQTKAPEEKVRRTLAETRGDIAEAILRLQAP